jgi:hypothetical protein
MVLLPGALYFSFNLVGLEHINNPVPYTFHCENIFCIELRFIIKLLFEFWGFVPFIYLYNRQVLTGASMAYCIHVLLYNAAKQMFTC